MKDSILITGHDGFLIGGLSEYLHNKYNVYKLDCDVRDDITSVYNNIQIVIHFASPSDDIEFKDKNKTVTTIVDGTINLLNLASKLNAKFVFASTLGVTVHDPDNIYTTTKLAMEHYIVNTYNNYVILRIPRVYDKTRKKGLMRKIRNNLISDSDMNKTVDYITLDCFVEQTKHALSLCNSIYNYNITYNKTIKDIKKWIQV